jgi:hypothetical protein
MSMGKIICQGTQGSRGQRSLRLNGVLCHPDLRYLPALTCSASSSMAAPLPCPASKSEAYSPARRAIHDRRRRSRWRAPQLCGRDPPDARIFVAGPRLPWHRTNGTSRLPPRPRFSSIKITRACAPVRYVRLIPCRFSRLMSPDAALSCGPAEVLINLSAGFFSSLCHFLRWSAARRGRAAARRCAGGRRVRAGRGGSRRRGLASGW